MTRLVDCLRLHARLFALAYLVVASALACSPRLPPVSGCSPLSQRCVDARPHVCSPTQRLHAVGDEPCAHGCVVNPDSGVAHCIRPRDAGEP